MVRSIALDQGGDGSSKLHHVGWTEAASGARPPAAGWWTPAAAPGCSSASSYLPSPMRAMSTPYGSEAASTLCWTSGATNRPGARVANLRLAGCLPNRPCGAGHWVWLIPLVSGSPGFDGRLLFGDQSRKVYSGNGGPVLYMTCERWLPVSGQVQTHASDDAGVLLADQRARSGRLVVGFEWVLTDVDPTPILCRAGLEPSVNETRRRPCTPIVAT